MGMVYKILLSLSTDVDKSKQLVCPIDYIPHLFSFDKVVLISLLWSPIYKQFATLSMCLVDHGHGTFLRFVPPFLKIENYLREIETEISLKISL